MATKLAKAYVQIVPSAKGIKGSISQALGGEAGNAGKSAGETFSGKLVSTIKTVIAAAGIGTALVKTITEGAALEQSIGGIETLFKDSAERVKQAAAEAYRTAGMSANEYMELATSFSASLLQSTAGDTAKAADIADMAMQDMSDNANKMGTSMEDIKNAYQGFAKQNYTMLDNLKLGYGGTQEEMKRLLADAQKITGVKYDISSLSDVYTAIHVIQGGVDELNGGLGDVNKGLGITGTTAKEAATTLSGSLASMKAAFKNVLGQLTLGQDVGPALSALAETVTTFLVGNLLPAVWNILSALPGALVTFFKAAAPQLSSALMQFLPQIATQITTGIPQMLASANQLISSFLSGFTAAYPQMLQTGGTMLAQLVSGVLSAMPQVIQPAMQVVSTLINTIVSNLPQILQTGTDVLMSLINGIAQNFPQVLVTAARFVLNMVSGIVSNLPQILAAGFNMVTTLIQGIGNAAPGIISAAGEIASMIWDTIKSIDWISLGRDIISGLINGIGSMAGALWDAATNIARSALNAIKSFFGIASPSKLMRDEVGRFIPAGIAAGIAANTRPITNEMSRLASLTTVSAQTDLRVRAAAVPVLEAVSGGVILNQTINTHDSLSPSEMTREAENFLRRARWKNP